jgi:hypothetical protein
MVSVALILSIAYSLSGAAEVSPPVDATGPKWSASAQVGGGALAGQSTLMLAPRLGVQASTARLQLGLPLFLKGDGEWANPWSSPETYLAMLESFVLTSGDGDFVLRIGTLQQETFGSGALIDDYGTGWDPLLPRPGVVAEWNLDGAHVYGMMNRLISPNLFVLGAALLPLRWLGDGDANRFLLTGEVAVDSTAPTAEGERALVAGDFGVRLIFHSGQFLQVEGLLNGVFLHDGRLGSHVSLLMEWSENAPLGGDWLAVQLEGIQGWEGYEPGYFDEGYDVERLGGLVPGEAPKSELGSGASSHVRLRLDGRWSFARFGLNVRSDLSGSAGMVAYLKWVHDRWSVMGLLRRRDLHSLSDLGVADHRTYGECELSAVLYEQLYGYTHVAYGWHFFAPERPERVVVGTAGVGVHFGGKIPRS